MAEGNGNGIGYVNGNKMVWWAMGLFGTMLILGMTILNTSLSSHDDRIRKNAEAIVELKTEVGQLKQVATMTREEQVKRTSNFGEVAVKLQALEMTDMAMKERYSGILERLQELSNRLNQQGQGRMRQLPAPDMQP